MKRIVVYELVDDDVQYVSEQILERRLNQKEISEMKNVIAEKINWFDAIEAAIYEKIYRYKK